MSYIQIQHETRTDPAFYESDDPVTCAECGREHDFDEERENYSTGYDGQPYCNTVMWIGAGPCCLHVAQRRSYIAELKERLLPVLEQAWALSGEISREHDGLFDGADEFDGLIDRAIAEVQSL